MENFFHSFVHIDWFFFTSSGKKISMKSTQQPPHWINMNIRSSSCNGHLILRWFFCPVVCSWLLLSSQGYLQQKKKKKIQWHSTMIRIINFKMLNINQNLKKKGKFNSIFPLNKQEKKNVTFSITNKFVIQDFYYIHSILKWKLVTKSRRNSSTHHYHQWLHTHTHILQKW